MGAKARKFWSIKNQGLGSAQIFIYDQIGVDWWTGNGIEANSLCQQIAALNVNSIDVYISSPGGSFHDGMKIYNTLKRHPAFVTTFDDSEAASIASILFLAGDRRVIAPAASMMIHLPSVEQCSGTADDLRKAADYLDVIRDSLVSIYRDCSNLPDAEILAALEAETYYNAEQALELGFATEIGEQQKIAALKRSKIDAKALGYRNPPQPLNSGATLPDNPDEPDNPDGPDDLDDSDNPTSMDLADLDADQTPGDEEWSNGHVPGCKCDDCAAKNNSTNAANAAHIKPQGAQNQEVTVMTQTAAAPVAGARDYNKEALEIITMCNTSGCTDKAKDFIEAKLSPEQTGLKILDLFHSGAIAAPAAEAKPIVDLGKAAGQYSYTKAISLMANQLLNKQKPDGLEWEVHQDLAKTAGNHYSDRGGILIPHRVTNSGNTGRNDAIAQATMALRGGNTNEALRILNTALTTTGTTTGSAAVFQEYGEFIDILRNMMVTTRMGARVLTGLKGPINFPKQTGAASLYWTGENPGTDVTQSNVTFGTVTLSPKTCQAQGALSRQLIIESTPDVEGIVRNDLAMIHALGWDYTALHGTGSNSQPTGIYNAASVNAVPMGGIPTYTKIVSMITAVATFNALLGKCGFVTNPLMSGLMMTTLKFPGTANGTPIWEGKHVEGMMAGYDAISSNQVLANMGAGTNEVGMVFGNWDDLMIGMWGALELLVDPYTLAAQGLLKITSFQMIDIALRRAQSFCKSTGATVS